MSLFLLYTFKGAAHRLAIAGLVSDQSDAEQWVSKNNGKTQVSNYCKVAPDMLFYSVRVESEEVPQFSFLAQAPLRASPQQVREKINADTPLAIEEFIKKRNMVGHWHAGTWKIVEISQGYCF